MTPPWHAGFRSETKSPCSSLYLRFVVDCREVEEGLEECVCKFGFRGWVELDTVVCKFGTRKSVGKWYRSLCQSTPPSYMQTIADLHCTTPRPAGWERVGASERARKFSGSSRERARGASEKHGRPHDDDGETHRLVGSTPTEVLLSGCSKNTGGLTRRELTEWTAAAHRHPEPAAVPAVAAVRLLFSVRRGEDEERRCTANVGLI